MDFQVVGKGVGTNIYVAYLNDRFLIFFSFFGFFLGPHLRHMEVSRLGVE